MKKGIPLIVVLSLLIFTFFFPIKNDVGIYTSLARVAFTNLIYLVSLLDWNLNFGVFITQFLLTILLLGPICLELLMIIVIIKKKAKYNTILASINFVIVLIGFIFYRIETIYIIFATLSFLLLIFIIIDTIKNKFKTRKIN